MRSSFQFEQAVATPPLDYMTEFCDLIANNYKMFSSTGQTAEIKDKLTKTITLWQSNT